MSVFQFMTKSEYKDYCKYGYADFKYPTKYTYDTKLEKHDVFRFLNSCFISLGLTLKEFNRLYLVELSSNKKINNVYSFILNKVGYAISPIELCTDTVISKTQCVCTY